MPLGKKITFLFGIGMLGIAAWVLPAMRGADRDPRWGRDAGYLPADVWHVEEGVNGQAVWVGTWRRHGRSDMFDAAWRNIYDGSEVRDRIRLIEARDRVVFHREGTNGEYMGRMSPDGMHMEGTATWFGPGGFWRADALASRR